MECPGQDVFVVSESEVRSRTTAVILSEPGSPVTGLRRWGGERGPWHSLQPFRGPHEQVFVRGVDVRGGESKDLRLCFKELMTHHSSCGSYNDCDIVVCSVNCGIVH
jgi:hypothetical protein